MLKNKIISPVVIALTIILTATTCKKEKNPHTTVNGTVTEYGSNKPIAGATVYIERADAGAVSAQAYSLFLTTKSDVDGKYSFSFDYEDAYQYEITAQDGGVHFQSEHHGIQKGENNINIIQYALGYLTLHVKNLNPYDANDHIGIGSTLTGSPIQLYGTDIDTVFTGV